MSLMAEFRVCGVGDQSKITDDKKNQNLVVLRLRDIFSIEEN